MKAIMVMYDSLNRHYLPNYGCDLTKMPNFERLGKRTVTFDRSYVASLPCMPARREIHTGRINFLHRGWSPLEPFDDSMPQILKQHKIYTHMVSDHQHYWEDGGATYHTRYQSWEIVRGQEGDPWKGSLQPTTADTSFGGSLPESIAEPEKLGFDPVNMHRQDAVNRRYITEAKEFPQAQTFSRGLEFIEENKDYDNWYLQIETFDPHEPFFSPEEYQALYRQEGSEPFKYDWPPYQPVKEDEAFVWNVRKKYFALLSMCDDHLGRVLDMMDTYDMWQDTMLIVNTDHGFMLGEHQWWAKGGLPLYEEISHTPLFIWDPRCKKQDERRKALVQTIDLAPTVLGFFDMDIPKDMQGKDLGPIIAADGGVRDYGLFGIFGDHINVTDGRYVYMRAAMQNKGNLNEYTLMPTQMRQRMTPEYLKGISLAEPFEFTKNTKVIKIPVNLPPGYGPKFEYGNLLYDLETVPGQETPIDDPGKEVEMINAMRHLMLENDAPKEQFARMGIPEKTEMTIEMLMTQRNA